MEHPQHNILMNEDRDRENLILEQADEIERLHGQLDSHALWLENALHDVQTLRAALVSGRHARDAGKRHWRPLARRLQKEFADAPGLAAAILAGHLDREIQEDVAAAIGVAAGE